MKSVLPISTLLLAAILLTPAMGYTIQVQNPNNYSISVGAPANYSIGTGVPAHETNYTTAAAPYAVQPAVTVTKSPYSFTTLGSISYSMSYPTVQGTQALGPQTSPSVARLGSMNQVQQAVAAVPEIPAATPAETAAPAATTPAETPAPAVTPAETPVEAAPAAAPATYSISGTVFDDVEGNGAREAEEAGLEGWTLELTGAAQNTTTTSADGSYVFANLASGNYTVTEVVPSGWNVISPAEGFHSISLTNADVTGVDFANQMAAAPAENTTAPAENVTAPAANATAPAA